MSDFQYGLQRPDGTHQVVNEANPIPVTVRALPLLQDTVVEHLDRLATITRGQLIALSQELSAAQAGSAGNTNTEMALIGAALGEQLRLSRKATIWCSVGLALLEIALILAVVFVR